LPFGERTPTTVRIEHDGTVKAATPTRAYHEGVHVVVVDDERRMVDLVTGYLDEVGFTTTGCFDGQQALQAARRPDVDAVVLDLMMPVVSGSEVCRRLRDEGNDVPILMLTARGSVAERVAGLEGGADDYLVKPFALEELVARLRAIRRRLDHPGPRLTVGDVVLDVLEQRVWVAGTEVELARRELSMLTALMENAGRVVSRSRLFDEVWGDEVDIRSNALDVHMSRLRARLEPAEQVRVHALRGVGYRLENAAKHPA
jgi:DNA-binding response OmpR family regulator